VRITATAIEGARLVELEPIEDERGFFARSFCREEFAAQGLDPCVAQCNVSFNRRRGTLRGMHFQRPPHAEAKLVRCTRGAIYDVIVDLRKESSSFLKWIAVELTAENRRALYIPQGVAHGFQTLEESSEVLYQMSELYSPDAAAGVRWDDPAFGIDWPIARPIVSARDGAYPDFSP
jgi:dTDP-4-dehydrorhamnose 3,5-epimerase